MQTHFLGLWRQFAGLNEKEQKSGIIRPEKCIN
jgi:hypothetical protein